MNARMVASGISMCITMLVCMGMTYVGFTLNIHVLALVLASGVLGSLLWPTLTMMICAIIEPKFKDERTSKRD